MLLTRIKFYIIIPCTHTYFQKLSRIQVFFSFSQLISTNFSEFATKILKWKQIIVQKNVSRALDFLSEIARIVGFY